MAEYIDRDALIDNLQKFAPDCYSAAVNNVIVGMPKADVAPVVHGKWVECEGLDFGFWVCSNCKFVSSATAAYKLYKYCPNCGAKMDEHAEEEV